MTDGWLDDVDPLQRDDGTPAATAVHDYLRRLILAGTIPPGVVVNQVNIADRLGISRTPVREAVRRLQDEGLLEAEPWKRARVAGFDPAQLEAVYVQRILLEPLGLALTIPRLDTATGSRLTALADELAGTIDQAGTPAWDDLHWQFHAQLVSGASEHLQRAIQAIMERATQYRALYRYRGPLPEFREAGDHRQIVDLARAGDVPGATASLAVHLARTALTLISQLAPDYDPAAIRLGLSLHHAGPVRASAAAS